MGRFSRLVGALFAAGVVCCGIASAEPEVKFIHGHPLGHAYVQKQWTMVMVRVKNEGDESIDVDCVMVVPRGLRQVQYVRPLHLPAHCERVGWFYGQFMGEKHYKVKVEIPKGQKGEGRRLSEGELWSNVLPWSRLFVLAADKERLLPAFDIYLSHREAYRVKGKEKRALHVGAGEEMPVWLTAGEVRRPATIYLKAADFPDHWAGYDTMHVAALGELDYGQWRPSQIDALEAWIEGGGIVLFFPGANFDSLAGSRMEKLLPVRLFGTRKLKTIPLQWGKGKWNVTLDDYVDIIESEVSDGEVVVSGGEFPMVVSKQIGMGAIYFFAFPGEVLNEWKERGTFLAHVLRSKERLKPLAQTQLLNEGPKMLDEVAGAKVAPPSFVVTALGSFFIVAALSLLVFFILGRGELAWPVIVPVGVVVAIASYRVGVRYGEKVGLSMNEIAVLSVRSGGRTAFRSAVLGVHTMEELNGELVASDENSLFATSTGEVPEGGEITNEIFHTSPKFRLINLSIPARSFPRFLVNSLVQLDGTVVAEFKLGSDGLRGTVTNNTDMQIKGCLLACSSYPYVIGDLAPGASKQIHLSDENVKSKGDFTTKTVLGDASVTRQRIIENLFLPQREFSFTPWARRVFLLGWPDRGFISEDLVGAKGEVQKRSSSLLCVEADVEAAAPGTAVLIPKAFTSVGIRRGGAGPMMMMPPVTRTRKLEDELPTITSNLLGPTEIQVLLPPFASNVVVEEAKLELNAMAYGFELVVQGKDRKTGKMVDLGTYTGLTGKKALVIKAAGRFQDPSRGVLALVIDSAPIEGKVPAGTLAAGWNLKDVAVTIKGTAR